MIRKHAGSYEVKVYNPATKKKEYIGRRKLERDAKKLEREAIERFTTSTPSEMTIREYADEWLRVHHGPGTRRLKASTLQVNEGNLRSFLEMFGDRKIDGGVTRREALAWSKPRPHVAKTVSAMFNDAVDGEVCKGNPFANRRHERSRGRKDIAPITEDELGKLAEIALEHWGPQTYGLVARAWVLFGAWVGCRPGETCTVTLRDLNFHEGTVTIRRVKPPYNVDTVVLPKAAADAVKDALHLLADEGPMFRTVTGKLLGPNLSWHWDPIRDKFEMTVSRERWNALLGGQPYLDFYSLRHFCASIMVDRGGNEFDGSAQLGNSPEVFRDTYMHDYADRVVERNRRLLDRETVVPLRSVGTETGA